MANPKATGRTKRLKDYRPQRRNANRHTALGLKHLAGSIGQYGIADGITVAADGESISGSARLETLADIMPDVKIVTVDTDGNTLLVNRRTDIPSADDPRAQALSAAVNIVQRVDYAPDGEILAALAAEDEMLKQMIAADEVSLRAVMAAQGEAGDNDELRSSLFTRFGVPPFSVLDARQGYWQSRKRAWLSLGIQSEIGRGGGVHQYSEAATIKRQGGTIGLDGSKVYGGG